VLIFIFYVLYCVHSHWRRVVGMVCMSFPSSSNRCMFNPLVCIVGIVASMSLSRLHSRMSNFILCILNGGCTNVVSLCCVW
jgi:hypothetical protein